jgi:hypothetical protein
LEEILEGKLAKFGMVRDSAQIKLNQRTSRLAREKLARKTPDGEHIQDPQLRL